MIKVNGGDTEESSSLFPSHLLDKLQEENSDKVVNQLTRIRNSSCASSSVRHKKTGHFNSYCISQNMINFPTHLLDKLHEENADKVVSFAMNEYMYTRVFQK